MIASTESAAERGARGPSRAWAALVLVLLFAASVALRWPHLNRRLDGSGWVTAHTLVTLDNFAEKGAAYFHFQPVVTYQNPGDCGIGWQEFRLLQDERANYYHSSYPVFGYLAPHAVFKMVGVRPSVLSLQCFNLALGLISTALIYLILERLLAGNASARVAGLWGAAVYLFAPATLFCHGTSYFLDMLAVPLFLACLYGVLRTRETPEKLGWRLFTAGAFFLTTFTEWIGFLLLGCVVLAHLVSGAWRRDWRGLLIVCVAGTASLLLTILLMSRLSPLAEVLEFLSGKFSKQSGMQSPEPNPFLAAVLRLKQFYFWYTGPLWLLAGVQIAWLLKRRLPWREWLQPAERWLLFLAAAPVVLHVLLLLGFNSHHVYGTLKAVPALALFSGILLARISDRATIPWRLPAALLAAVYLHLSGWMYLTQAFQAHVDEDVSDLGLALKGLARPEEVLVMETPLETIEPQIMYYAGRSILYYKGDDAVRAHLTTHGLKEAVIVTVTAKREITGVRRLSL